MESDDHALPVSLTISISNKLKMPPLPNINDLIEQAVADYNNDNTYNTIHNLQGAKSPTF
jgi:hypothetical protein